MTSPFKVKRHVKHKKVFQVYILRRVGTGWELTNGSTKFTGPNRVELLELMDQWETVTRENLRASKVGAKTTKNKNKSPAKTLRKSRNPKSAKRSKG